MHKCLLMSTFPPTKTFKNNELVRKRYMKCLFPHYSNSNKFVFICKKKKIIGNGKLNVLQQWLSMAEKNNHMQ